MNTVEKKLQQFKALLGDDAAKEVLAEAERRETAAKEAGIEFKEKTRTKADEDKPDKIRLSAVLEQLDTGLQEGWIEDDVEEDSDETENESEPTEGSPDLEAMGKEIAEFVNERIKEEMEKLDAKFEARLKTGFLPRREEAQTQVKELRAEFDKTAKLLQAQQAQLAELMGLRPARAKGYRASEDVQTVREKEKAEAEPAMNPVDEFIGHILGESEPLF